MIRKLQTKDGRFGFTFREKLSGWIAVYREDGFDRLPALMTAEEAERYYRDLTSRGGMEEVAV